MPAPEAPSRPWHSNSGDAAAADLACDPRSGLTEGEAAARLLRYGRNELTRRRARTVWDALGEQLRDVMLWVLLAAVAISLAMGERTDALVIVAILALNSILGLVQERKAEHALQALRALAAPRARVRRDGVEVDRPAAELVPGDVVLLEAGNLVPADLRLWETADLAVAEAALTGESVDVAKDAAARLPADAQPADRTNMAFAGTVITRGRGCGLVVATGDSTEVGTIARLLHEVDEGKTPLQARLEQLGRTLAVAVLGICLVVFVTGLLRGLPVLELFLTAVSLAVAAIPEGLPAVVTIVLALGTASMVRRQVVTRRLRAVETLGSTTLICADKTGTLTQNQMTVRHWWTPAGEGSAGGEGYTAQGDVAATAEMPPEALRRLAEIAALCNDARFEPDPAGWRAAGDPTEAALLAFAGRAGVDVPSLRACAPRETELAFDAHRRRMTVICSGPEGRRAYTKGAPEAVLPRCVDVDQQGAEAVQAAYASQGLRVMALAYRDLPADPTSGPGVVEQNLVFAGLVGIMDPPRAEAKDAIRASRAAGVRPVMITGDHAATAAAIARELELAPGGELRVVTGRDLAAIPDAELPACVAEVHVFARVSPADKLRIVSAYQAAGEVVAMTGDGVNDGPALKKADVGVAMGAGGTDVARGAADIVLLDDNFASIVAAVEEGRRIFDNIRKFVFYLLSCNISEVLTLFLAVLVGLPQPLLPVQLLWLNLVTDGLPALALGLEPPEPHAMCRPPRPPREGVLTRATVKALAVYGCFMTAAALAAYAHGLYWFCLVPQGYGGWEGITLLLDAHFWRSPAAAGGLVAARTLAFGTLAFSQLAHALNSRSDHRSVFSQSLRANLPLVAAIGLSALAQGLVINTPWGNRAFGTVPIGGVHLAVAVALSASPLLLGECRKWLHRREKSAGAVAMPWNQGCPGADG